MKVILIVLCALLLSFACDNKSSVSQDEASASKSEVDLALVLRSVGENMINTCYDFIWNEKKELNHCLENKKNEESQGVYSLERTKALVAFVERICSGMVKKDETLAHLSNRIKNAVNNKDFSSIFDQIDRRNVSFCELPCGEEFKKSIKVLILYIQFYLNINLGVVRN